MAVSFGFQDTLRAGASFVVNQCLNEPRPDSPCAPQRSRTLKAPKVLHHLPPCLTHPSHILLNRFNILGLLLVRVAVQRPIKGWQKCRIGSRNKAEICFPNPHVFFKQMSSPVLPSHCPFCTVSGFVSSKRKLHSPPYLDGVAGGEVMTGDEATGVKLV